MNRHTRGVCMCVRVVSVPLRSSPSSAFVRVGHLDGRLYRARE